MFEIFFCLLVWPTPEVLDVLQKAVGMVTPDHVGCCLMLFEFLDSLSYQMDRDFLSPTQYYVTQSNDLSAGLSHPNLTFQ